MELLVIKTSNYFSCHNIIMPHIESCMEIFNSNSSEFFGNIFGILKFTAQNVSMKLDFLAKFLHTWKRNNINHLGS